MEYPQYAYAANESDFTKTSTTKVPNEYSTSYGPSTIVSLWNRVNSHVIGKSVIGTITLAFTGW